MDRVREAIDKLKARTHVSVSYLPSIKHYLQTGDRASLAKITPFGQRGSWWGYLLVESLRPVSEWEDRRSQVDPRVARRGHVRVFLAMDRVGN